MICRDAPARKWQAMSDNDTRLSVVVLNFRTPEQTTRAVECLASAAPGVEIETIVVDNASGDGSVDAIRQRLPHVLVVEMNENLGFAAGMNAGAREASGDYVLLLNSDVEGLPGSLGEMLDYMKANPMVGLVAPLLVDENEKPIRTLLVGPTLWRTLIPALGKLRYKQWRKLIGSEPLDVEATEGAAVLVSRAAIEKAGLLDEEFFFYHEIVEWCMRMRDKGFRVVIVPSARMKHLCGGSTGGVWLPARIELKRSEYQLIRKRLGASVRLFAIARDFISAAWRCLVYGLASAAGFKRAGVKLSAHGAVLSWLVMGMPGRRETRYVSRFGGWSR